MSPHPDSRGRPHHSAGGVRLVRSEQLAGESSGEQPEVRACRRPRRLAASCAAELLERPPSMLERTKSMAEAEGSLLSSLRVSSSASLLHCSTARFRCSANTCRRGGAVVSELGAKAAGARAAALAGDMQPPSDNEQLPEPAAGAAAAGAVQKAHLELGGQRRSCRPRQLKGAGGRVQVPRGQHVRSRWVGDACGLAARCRARSLRQHDGACAGGKGRGVAVGTGERGGGAQQRGPQLQQRGLLGLGKGQARQDGVGSRLCDHLELHQARKLVATRRHRARSAARLTITGSKGGQGGQLLQQAERGMDRQRCRISSAAGC